MDTALDGRERDGYAWMDGRRGISWRRISRPLGNRGSKSLQLSVVDTVISTRSRWRAAFVGERETSAALSAVSCSLSGSDSFPLSLPSLLISKSDVCNASMRRRRDETHPLSRPLSFSFARRVVVPARRSSSFFSWMDRCDRRSSFFLRAANLE